MIAWSSTAIKAFNPEIEGKITSSALITILKEKNIKKYEVTDNLYNLIKRSNMVDFIDYNFSKLRDYKKTIFDCDNFSAVLYGQMSYVLSGFAVGIVHINTKTGKHALNFFIDDKLNWYYIEPQTNRIFTYNAGKKKGYSPYFVLI